MEQVINTTNNIDIIQSNGVNGVLSTELKEKAKALLSNLSIPTTKTEAWKYTRVGKISNKKFDIQSGIVNSIDTFSVFKEATTIVFVNGFFDEKLSNLSEQVNVHPLSKVSSSEIDPIGKSIQLENEIFNTLNTIYATDGAFIQIKANEVLETPIQIINIGTGTNTIAATRNVIVADKNSKASILISYFSENANETFTNAITEVIVKENAHLSIDKLQLENNTSYQIST